MINNPSGLWWLITAWMVGVPLLYFVSSALALRVLRRHFLQESPGWLLYGGVLGYSSLTGSFAAFSMQVSDSRLWAQIFLPLPVLLVFIFACGVKWRGQSRAR